MLYLLTLAQNALKLKIRFYTLLMEFFHMLYFTQYVWISAFCFLDTVNAVSLIPSNKLVVNGSANKNIQKLISKEMEIIPHEYGYNDYPQPKQCQRNATCEPLEYKTCFGVKLPYSSTSTILISNDTDQHVIQDELQKWKGLIHIPRCWAVVQPFLCSLYMPKCENNIVDLPSLEMCEKVRYPCRILETDGFWPDEFRCDLLYKSKCKNNVRELKFNITGQCQTPLVSTQREISFYDGIEGCGIQCQDPFYNHIEKHKIRSWMAWLSFLSFWCNLFAVLTFIIDWRSSRKYPTRVLFFMNVCYLLSTLGYIYKFFPWETDSIVSCDNGTLRRTSQSPEGNLYCYTNFLVVYYFFMAGVVWFVVFAYTWSLRCKTIGAYTSRKVMLTKWYHTAAWAIPFGLSVLILALDGVDGDSLLGICFVGVVNKHMRVYFFWTPLIISSVIGMFFLGKCIYVLEKLMKTSNDVPSETAKKKIRSYIFRLWIFFAPTFVFFVIFCYYFISDSLDEHLKKENLRKLIVCQLGVVGDMAVDSCRLSDPPGIPYAVWRLVAIFGTHINVSSWLWSRSTFDVWYKFSKKMSGKVTEEPDKLTKHEIIAEAFKNKKHLLDSEGDHDINIYKNRDPLDLDFDVNSVVSRSFSSTWAKALPRLLRRRPAMGEIFNSQSSQHCNSVYSETSISVRRFSIESQKRNSCDSTVSVQAVEVTKTVRKKQRTKGLRKKSYSRSSKKKAGSKSSCSSLPGNLDGDVLMAALKIGNFMTCTSVPNSRRAAITNIDENALKLVEMMNIEDLGSNNNNASDSESISWHETDALKS